jgi:hypothetical protein
MWGTSQSISQSSGSEFGKKEGETVNRTCEFEISLDVLRARQRSLSRFVETEEFETLGRPGLCGESKDRPRSEEDRVEVGEKSRE